MTTRVQENRCLQREFPCPQLGMLEKTMLCQASLKTAGKVLDANVCSGPVAEYLLANTDCQVCGVSDRMEEIRQVRETLYGGDFAYGAIGDIPWQENTFDTVLLHPSEGGEEALREQLRECKRVLKPGGQLVLGLKSLPLIIRQLSHLLWDEAEDKLPDAQTALQMLESMGFEKITRVQAAFSGHVISGWLPEEA